MSLLGFRFLHAADFHLEQPLCGVDHVPDALRDVFLEAPYWAAERVFEAALREQVDFVLLAGDLLEARLSGPRGPRFLIEQFQRLAAANIHIYWAGGQVDAPEQWPEGLRLPDNVHRFPTGRVERVIHQRDGRAVVQLLGRSGGRRRRLAPDEFEPEADSPFSIAVAHGRADAESLRNCSTRYWALGGKHATSNLATDAGRAHYPGTCQGRRPSETGPHGCTLVEVGEDGRVSTRRIPTEVIRWCGLQTAVHDQTSPQELQADMASQIESELRSSAGLDLLVGWTVTGNGPLMRELRREALKAELLAELRARFGHNSPVAWSASLEVDPTAEWTAEEHQETLLGDYLLEVQRYQEDDGPALDLADYLGQHPRQESAGGLSQLDDARQRGRILREAAVLGIDLLTGEEPPW